MAQWLLEPPKVNETPAGFGRLFWRYPIARGDTLLIYGSQVIRTRTPSVQEYQDADYAFSGGHVFVIDDTVKAILDAAGYGYCITALEE